MDLFRLTNVALRLETRTTDSTCRCCSTPTISGQLNISLRVITTNAEICNFCWCCAPYVLTGVASEYDSRYMILCSYFFVKQTNK